MLVWGNACFDQQRADRVTDLDCVMNCYLPAGRSGRGRMQAGEEGQGLGFHCERISLLGSFQLPMSSLPQFHTQFDTQFLHFPSDPSFPSLYPSSTQFGPVSLAKANWTYDGAEFLPRRQRETGQTGPNWGKLGQTGPNWTPPTQISPSAAARNWANWTELGQTGANWTKLDPPHQISPLAAYRPALRA